MKIQRIEIGSKWLLSFWQNCKHYNSRIAIILAKTLRKWINGKTLKSYHAQMAKNASYAQSKTFNWKMNQERVRLLLFRHLAPSGDGVPLIPKKERDFFVPQNWSQYFSKSICLVFWCWANIGFKMFKRSATSERKRDRSRDNFLEEQEVNLDNNYRAIIWSLFIIFLQIDACCW